MLQPTLTVSSAYACEKRGIAVAYNGSAAMIFVPRNFSGFVAVGWVCSFGDFFVVVSMVALHCVLSVLNLSEPHTGCGKTVLFVTGNYPRHDHMCVSFCHSISPSNPHS